MRHRIGQVRGFVAKTPRPWSHARPRNDDRRDREGCPARFALPLHPLRVVSRHERRPLGQPRLAVIGHLVGCQMSPTCISASSAMSSTVRANVKARFSGRLGRATSVRAARLFSCSACRRAARRRFLRLAWRPHISLRLMLRSRRHFVSMAFHPIRRKWRRAAVPPRMGQWTGLDAKR
jgi:hypothetical protein